ncbi:aminoacyl-tRNA hydrolase [Dissulfuribacter thermophilus]|uniref:aminoacyl-tRNA hydrolase n=1 Tax=Dissulfuribacter thermophilus TaxID=1156395 RepID=UPI001FCA1F6E|nr:aminoacyl-tRNA hydrolase [Dissulfuribacter thermophilus]
MGLGNPGRCYEKTRHNAGFLLCEHIREFYGLPPFEDIERFKGEYTEGLIKGNPITLFRPLTYMNKSGEAVAPLVNYYKIDLQNVLVCYDDLDLPLGKIRFARSGGSGGHRGIESIIGQLGTKSFPRLRIGIGRPPEALAVKEYVLQSFWGDQLTIIEKVLDLAKDGVVCFLEKGITEAMNSYNGRIIEQ